MTYLLGSIRVHQGGGPPIFAAPMRHPSHPRPRPHQHGGSNLACVKAVRPRALALRALRLDPPAAANLPPRLDRPFHIRRAVVATSGNSISKHLRS